MRSKGGRTLWFWGCVDGKKEAGRGISAFCDVTKGKKNSIMVYFCNCLIVEHDGLSSLIKSINTNSVYMDTNYRNKSQVRL